MTEEVTLKEMCRILQGDLGCKPIRFYLPLGFAGFIARSMEKKTKKGGKKPIMTSFRNNIFDYSKYKRN